MRDNILESISQIKGQVVIKVSGSDLDVLNQQAQAILGQVRSVEGVESAFIDRDGSLPQLQIEIDRDRAARYGLNVRDIDEVIETALGGRQVGELWEGDRRFRSRCAWTMPTATCNGCARCRSASAMATR